MIHEDFILSSFINPEFYDEEKQLNNEIKKMLTNKSKIQNGT